MNGKKTGLIIAVVALVLCVLVGVVGIVAFGGWALLTARPGPVAITESTPLPTPARSADVKGFAVAGAITDTTLSTFETDGLACRWTRLDPVAGAKAEVATIDGPCSGARVAWTSDGANGILWLDPLEEGWKGTAGNGDPGQGGDRMWTVHFADGVFTALPRPPDGELMELAFDDTGAPIAITSEEIPETDQQKGYVEYRGQRFDIPNGEGLPILAHAFRLNGKEWSVVETKASDDGTDVSVGVRALDIWKKLAPRTSEMLSGQPDAKPVDAETAKKLEALASSDAGQSGGDEDSMTPGNKEQSGDDGDDDASAGADDGEWRELTTAGGPVYVWEENAEGLYATGLVAFRNGDKFERPEKLDLTGADATSPMWRGPWLLLAGQDGEEPHLYDVRSRKLVWSDDKATGTVFWPR